MTEEREKVDDAESTAATRSSAAEYALSDADFADIRDIIYQASGIYIAERRKYLVQNRLASRIRALKLAGFRQYRDYLLHDPARHDELERLFEAITINETSFFRNRPQLAILQDTILPALCRDLRAQGKRNLRIWSAGCSTGEEPYTLAIIVREVLRGELPAWDVRITANDISAAVLETARRGVYSAYTMRNVPPDFVPKYFTKNGEQFAVRPEVRSLVSFERLNLNSVTETGALDHSHIIFCRNVIIYFDDAVKGKVISEFYRNLLPGGYLFIGHSETLHAMENGLTPEMVAGGLVYRKQNAPL